MDRSRIGGTLRRTWSSRQEWSPRETRDATKLGMEPRWNVGWNLDGTFRDLAFVLPPYYWIYKVGRPNDKILQRRTLSELSNRTYRTSPSGPTALTVSLHSLPVPTVCSESKSLRALQRPILILPHQQRCIPSSPSVANPWGHIPAWLSMTKCLRERMKYRFLGAQSLDSMTNLKCDYAISGHAPDASLLALQNRNEKLRGLLRDGICIRSGRQLFRTYTQYSGKMLTFQDSRNIFRIRWLAAAAYTSAIADNPDFRVCE